MVELELSIMAPTVFREPNPVTELQELLKEFESEQGVRVRINALQWPTGWTEMVKGALFGHGPDVSEIGTTWMSSFIGMNALLPLTTEDIEAVGGPSSFLPQAWQTGYNDKQMWGVPWLAGARVLFYRRDILEKAGVDEATAFTTHQQLVDTLERIRVHSRIMPWVVPTNSTLSTLHNVANWVWGAGGDFMSPDGKQPLFIEKEACNGIRQYFELQRFLPRCDLDDYMTGKLFWQQKEAAVTMMGHWVSHAYESTADPKVIANLGVSIAPGMPFIGGSNLAVWKYTSHKNAAFALLRFLSRPEVQISYSKAVGLLPVNINALANPCFGEGLLNPVVRQGLHIGRTYPLTLLWGLVEDRLTTAFNQIWSQIIINPEPDFTGIINQHLEPVAHSLRFALRTSGESQRRVRELQLLQDVSLAAASGLRLEDTLQAAVEALSSQLDGSPVAILILDDEGKELVLKANTGYPLTFSNFHIKSDSGIVGWVTLNGEPLIVPDVRQEIRYFEGISETRSELCVPLKTGAKVIGVLDVESPQINAFTEEDQRLLSTLANNLAIMIERARLFEEVEAAKFELEQRAERLAHQSQELSHSNKELEQFAYVASHDLQEPLRKIQAFGDQLKTKYSHLLDAQGVDFLERMQNASNRMQLMIDDLLTLSRVTTQGRPFIPVNLHQIAEGAVSDLEIRIEKTAGKVEIFNLPIIEADPTQMRQLLVNLIGNALKFHKEDLPPVINVYSERCDKMKSPGETVLSARLIETNQCDSGYLIFVEDNGIGFEEKYLEKIFQPFQRLHGKDKYEGCGIGLAICRKIVEHHHGYITAKSCLGEGTTFIVYLPEKHLLT